MHTVRRNAVTLSYDLVLADAIRASFTDPLLAQALCELLNAPP